MQATQSVASASARPTFHHSSRTIENQDRRTRQLASALLRLNAEGGATRSALLREGFSAWELDHLTIAATQIANRRFVRQVDDVFENLKTDEELLAIAGDRVAGIVDIGQIVSTLRGDLNFTPDVIARIWPKLMVKLAAALAVAPVPAA